MNNKIEDLVKSDLKHIWHPCSQMKDYEDLPPIIIKQAHGVYLYDYEGKEYLDIISSWWANLLGHTNEKISDAISKQLKTLEHIIFSNFSHIGAIKLCEELVKVLPKGLNKFNFSDNGSAAVECALKLSFQYQYQIGNKKKTRFMKLSDGYHGETIGALSVGALDLYAKIYKPMLMDTIEVYAPDCYRCPYGETRNNCICPCFERVEKSFKDYGAYTAAIILEPLLQGAAGMRIYPPLFLEKMRKICDEYDVLLIADEIATGFGRTGEYFSFSHTNVSPDIMTLSKGLTGGYMPMSITVTTDEIYNAFYDDYNKHVAFMHSHTYSGNPLGCASALAVLEILREDNIIEKSRENAKYLREKLKDTFNSHKNIGEIRSLNLINALEIVEDRKTKKSFDSNLRLGYEIYKKALDFGLILRPLGDVIYFNPPLTIEKKDLDKAIELTKKSIDAILK